MYFHIDLDDLSAEHFQHLQVDGATSVTIAEGGMPGFIHVTATLSPKYMCVNRTSADNVTVCEVVVWVTIETTDQELQCYQVRKLTFSNICYVIQWMYACIYGSIKLLIVIQSNCELYMCMMCLYCEYFLSDIVVVYVTSIYLCSKKCKYGKPQKQFVMESIGAMSRNS